MAYNPEDQSHHLLMDLIDNMTSFTDFDNAVSVLIEWGLIGEGVGAIAPELWKEAQEWIAFVSNVETTAIYWWPLRRIRFAGNAPALIIERRLSNEDFNQGKMRGMLAGVWFIGR